jgi:hypothetical protein
MTLDVRATRRSALAMIAAAAFPSAAFADGRPLVTVHKDPNCGCCSDWIKHLERAGFPVNAIDTGALAAAKTRLGVPGDLSACHTAEVAGYVVEGHVPAVALIRFLAEKPQAVGLAVPGMPIGSPGMEGGEPETYDVIMFGKSGRRVFMRCKGDREV